MSYPNAKLRLFQLLSSYALKRGDFTLKSGRKSNYLIDCKGVVLSAQGHLLVGEVMHDTIKSYSPEAVAGVELGGCPLASAVAMYSVHTYRPIHAIYVRKEQKAHGSKSLLELPRPIVPSAIYAPPVIVLEDVGTTGGSALSAVNQLKAGGLNVLGVCVLVDRLEGAREAVEKENLQFWSVFTRTDFGADLTSSTA